MANINNLLYTDTFKTWFDTTNSIINSVNGITVYNILAGDGIGVTSTNGVFTISHGSNVTGGVTFNGSVSFNGTVTFAKTPTTSATTITVSPKIVGLTAGNVVRISATGLTLAKADSRPNSEVLGVIIDQTSSAHVVAVNGTISNSVFTNTIANALGVVGGTLIGGQPYFLDPTVAGGITAFEPNTYGQVSKPIILGITGDAGAILQYRGQEIAGITAGLTAELDNKIIVSVDYSGNIHGTPITTRCANINGASYPILVGQPVWLIPTATGDLDESSELNFWDLGHCHMFGRVNGGNSFLAAYTSVGDGWGTQANASPQKQLYGLISKILVDDRTNKIWVFEITKPGGSFVTTYADLVNPSSALQFYNPSILNGGPFFLAAQTDDGSRAGFFQNFMYCPSSAPDAFTSVNYDGLNYLSVTPIGDVNQSLNIYLDPLAGRHKLVTISGYTAGLTYGSCAITDITDITEGESGGGGGGGAGRKIYGLTGALEYDNLIPNGSFSIWQRGITGISTSNLESLAAWSFADCWWGISSQTITGITFNASRQGITYNQTDIPGSPLYYVNVSTKYGTVSNAYDRPRLENIRRGARLLQGQQATVSFWAKTDTVGATMDLVYTRYPESIDATKYADVAPYQTIITSGVTLNSLWSNYKYTFTVNAINNSQQGFPLTDTDEGWFGLAFEFPSSTATISIAQVQLEAGSSVTPIVYMSPDKELAACKPYYLRTYDWDQANAYSGTSRINEYTLQVGNLLTQRLYTIPFPVRMVANPNNTSWVTLYSPSGQTGDAYNVNANADMRNSANGTVNLPWNSSTFRTCAQSGNITVNSVTRDGMVVSINNGATHLDTLKFHYVVDANIPFTTF